MASTFTWLDHSESDKQRMLDAIDSFKETETRDELGLGAIRDGFADRLFPGTSTIQTRARYFLFIPWMYRQLEEKGVSSADIEARGRREEIRLLTALLESGSDEGLIGKVAREKLKRLPSSVYWNGLGAWRIRLFGGSIDEYHRSFERFQERRRDLQRDDDKDVIGGMALDAWHPHLPDAPADFPKSVTFDLRREDAKYLAERVILSSPKSLLALIIRRGYTVDVDYPWAHPDLANFPEQIRFELHHASMLSDTTYGAALLYNLLLSEALPPGDARDENVEWFRKRIAEWVAEMAPRQDAIAQWDRKAFWSLVREMVGPRPTTEKFVDTWLNLQPWTSEARAADDATCRALVRDREKQLKRGRARIGNPRALELWNGNSGTGRLTYRWYPAQRLLKDIQNGLGKEAPRALAG